MVEEPRGDDTLVEYRSEAGTLREVRRAGQIIRHKVGTVEELRVLAEMLRHLEVREDLRRYELVRTREDSAGPVVVMVNGSSAVQQMLQYETGVESFWYLLADARELVEEALELGQAALEAQYRIMGRLGARRWYQAENTSTTMISPRYYERYSLGHVRQFTGAAQAAGARTVVHMCGLLRDLLPLLRRTEMNGIHLLTPPPVGNVEFREGFAAFPDDFIIMGRFGSLEWIGKTKEQILASLRRLAPPEVYRERAFLLMVAYDGARFERGDLERVRDAVEEFEGEG